MIHDVQINTAVMISNLSDEIETHRRLITESNMSGDVETREYHRGYVLGLQQAIHEYEIRSDHLRRMISHVIDELI